jgi:hypothetical protein
MGARLGSGLHDLIIAIFHMWHWILFTGASVLAAATTVWATVKNNYYNRGFSDGYQTRIEQARQARLARLRDEGLKTPRPPGLHNPHHPHERRRRRWM